MRKTSERRCMSPGCGDHDASPQFTAPLSSIRKDRRTRQPKWYCGVHGPKHPNVGCFGQPRRAQFKSYEIVTVSDNGNGEKKILRPLPLKDSYERYWARRREGGVISLDEERRVRR